MTHYIVRCKVEQIARNIEASRYDWARCEDMRFVQARFMGIDNAKAFMAWMLSIDKSAMYAEVGA